MSEKYRLTEKGLLLVEIERLKKIVTVGLTITILIQIILIMIVLTKL